jgi:hypothetical protein
LALGDGNIENQSFALTDFGVNPKIEEAAQAAWGSDAKVPAWPKDIEGLKAMGLAGANGGQGDQAVFRQNPSPAYADNSAYLSLAGARGHELQGSYDNRQRMLGSGSELKPIADYAGIRRTSSATLSLEHRISTT